MIPADAKGLREEVMEPYESIGMAIAAAEVELLSLGKQVAADDLRTALRLVAGLRRAALRASHPEASAPAGGVAGLRKKLLSELMLVRDISVSTAQALAVLEQNLLKSQRTPLLLRRLREINEKVAMTQKCANDALSALKASGEAGS